jgi:hypothetical protein
MSPPPMLAATLSAVRFAAEINAASTLWISPMLPSRKDKALRGEHAATAKEVWTRVDILQCGVDRASKWRRLSALTPPAGRDV